jgi:cytosine/adenosine deaminase-related metal-dependent hydrolase
MFVFFVTDICDLVFCPLSQAKVLSHILNAVKATHKVVTSINLSHNDLSSLRALEALWMIQTLAKLDLRHNMVIRL